MANEIFISYRRSDEPRARMFYNMLKERGVEAWYDAKIEAGEDWRTSTANALDAAPIFVLLMSKLASESGDIAKELAAATHKRKLVVPVRLDDMQLEGVFLYELASRNWINAFKDTELRLAELADKLAALVKSDLSPEAAAALEVNVAEIAAAKGLKSKGKGVGSFMQMQMQKSGSVALITAAVVAVVAAAGAGAWFLKGSSSADAEATSIVARMATAGSPEGLTPGTAPGTAGTAPAAATPEAAKLSLTAALTQAATAAKEAGRSDEEVAALTEASAKVAALAEKATTGGDTAAIGAEMNDTALAAARKQIAALAADPVIASVKGDFKTAATELKSAGIKADAQLAKAIEESDAAQAAIKAAGETAAGTDGSAAVAAVGTAQQSLFTLVALKPVANDAYIKAKRQSYASNSAAARTSAGEIAKLAGMKKPGVFASSERKDAYKYVVATDAWARSRVAEIDMLASSVGTADRKAAAKYASQAATARTELQSALVNVKAEAAKAAAN